MICVSCGVDIDENAVTCPACGADVRRGYFVSGPSMGRLGKGVMYYDWAFRWICIAVFGFLFAVILLGMSISAESSDAGLMRGLGLLFLGLGLLGAYVTYLNFRKRKGV